MIYLTQNIKHLRKVNGWTQQRLADELKVKRAIIGAYEEGRATPKIPVLQRLALLFNHTIDELVGIDLTNSNAGYVPAKRDIQVLPIVVDKNNEELIPIVPVKASAGYLNGLADPEFIEKLPCFSIPIPELSNERTYRVFQINGDSMLPIPSEAYVFCELIEQVQDIIDGQTYVLITRNDGLVYKRAFKNDDSLLLKSDNPEYSPYKVNYSTILEIWKAKGVLSFDMPEPVGAEMANITSLLMEVKDEIRQLKK